jgi:hypothetical protein
MFSFLTLPRELRDDIYAYYAAQDGGYLYNQRTRKLRTASRGPVDLSLMQTCSQIAHELRPVIFKMNIITFRTQWIDRETSDRAASFATALKYLHAASARQLSMVRTNITEDIIERAGTEFPQCVPLLHHFRSPSGHVVPSHIRLVHDWRAWRHAPSTHRDFVNYMLSLRKGSRKWWEFWKDDEILGQRLDQPNIASLLARIPDPWTIPDEEDVASLKEQCISWNPSMSCSPHYNDGPIKRYFSAAALAIQFLHSLDSNTLSAICHIVLDEAHASVAYPECHGLGLVGILQQYPCISVSRRVDTKTTVITGKVGQPYFEQIVRLDKDGDPWNSDGRIDSTHVSQAFMRWFEEAVALSSAMPPDRISLTFHSRNTASTLAILEQILEDAKWQSTLERLAPRPTSPLSLMDTCCFFSESFTRVTREIERNEGSVRFDIGKLHVSDRDTHIQVNSDSTPWQIGIDWMDKFRGTHLEPSPYSSRKDILQEYTEDEVED